MVQLRDRWEEAAGQQAEDTGGFSGAVVRRLRSIDDLLEEGRLELSHVRRLLDELIASRSSGELDSWSQRRYDALCNLERELLKLQA
jgi:hypothetical protein